jgi:hypothetical protein
MAVDASAARTRFHQVARIPPFFGAEETILMRAHPMPYLYCSPSQHLFYPLKLLDTPWTTVTKYPFFNYYMKCFGMNSTSQTSVTHSLRHLSIIQFLGDKNSRSTVLFLDKFYLELDVIPGFPGVVHRTSRFIQGLFTSWKFLENTLSSIHDFQMHRG